MSQENKVNLQCTVCKQVINFTKRNKKVPKKLELKKFCKFCVKHALHKETK